MISIQAREKNQFRKNKNTKKYEEVLTQGRRCYCQIDKLI